MTKPIHTENQYNIPIKINELKLHVDNPRTLEDYKDKDLEILKESLNKNGQINPIIVDENNIILSGHRRYYSALKLGWEYLRCDVKTGLTPLNKKCILLTTNITQKQINAWENRDIIANIYWDNFLDEYKPSGIHDKGYTEFSSMIGLSKTHAMKIIETSNPVNRSWLKKIRESNFPPSLADTIIHFPEEKRNSITNELIGRKIKNPSVSGHDLKRFARQLNRDMTLDNKKIYPQHMFNRLKTVLYNASLNLKMDYLELLSKEQKKQLKKLIETKYLVFYNKLDNDVKILKNNKEETKDSVFYKKL